MSWLICRVLGLLNLFPSPITFTLSHHIMLSHLVFSYLVLSRLIQVYALILAVSYSCII